MRVASELAHLAVGVCVAVMIASLAAWAVPRAKATIWMIDYIAIAGVLAMGIPALRTARAADLAERTGEH